MTEKNSEQIKFEDLFDLAEIQQIQDAFAAATNVASLITAVDGHPITEPGNFKYLPAMNVEQFGLVAQTLSKLAFQNY